MADHAILIAEQHRDLRVRTDRGAALGDAVMYALIVPDEFRRVQASYPIIFQRDRVNDGFVPLALFGFEAGENLYLDGRRWDASYLPLSIDIQPFLIGRTSGEGETAQVHLDQASPRIGHGEGVRVFEDGGRPTPYLEGVTQKLGALDAGYRGTAGFIAALTRHELLEPFTVEVTLDDGQTNRLVGFHAIDEDKLQALDADALGGLHRDGHLMPIFMALASLSQLAGLIARKNRQVARG